MSTDAEYFDSLLEQAKAGIEPSAKDLGKVVNALRSPNSDVDPYTLLHIIGKSGDRSAESLVREFLSFGIAGPDDDGMVRRIALQILADWWCVKTAFPDAVKMAFSDPSPFVRAVAASAIGKLGRVHPELESEAADALLRGLEERENDESEVWGSFYIGMLEMVSVHPREWPIDPGALEPDQLNTAIVEQIRKAAKPEASGT